ncbi:MAG: hypothetical protein WCF55_10615, partial [Pseudolabrys sp.]
HAHFSVRHFSSHDLLWVLARPGIGPIIMLIATAIRIACGEIADAATTPNNFVFISSPDRHVALVALWPQPAI